MSADTNSETRVQRTVLRDLVALSAIPAALLGREPAAVAEGLADVLIELLRLDFVFVRLRFPSAADAVDVTRGTAWETFPAWLESHRGESGRLAGIEIIPDVDGVNGTCHGIAIPIGFSAEGGVVAAASDRIGFPTETDQLLLGLAANHAATAFQNATLLHERARAEEELRRATDVLETKVAERTAELRRSEAYLSEAQRLTHTGTAALDGDRRGNPLLGRALSLVRLRSANKESLLSKSSGSAYIRTTGRSGPRRSTAESAKRQASKGSSGLFLPEGRRNTSTRSCIPSSPRPASSGS